MKIFNAVNTLFRKKQVSLVLMLCRRLADSQIVNLPIPVGLRVGIQGAKDDRQDDVNVVADKVDNVFILWCEERSVTVGLPK